jgi:hypothetical protein
MWKYYNHEIMVYYNFIYYTDRIENENIGGEHRHINSNVIS